MSLPPFDANGLLPPGTYSLTFGELRASHLVTGQGAGASGSWDSTWRAHLVKNAEILVTELWQVGIKEIFFDGSFVEAKDHPNDIDGYFECHPLAVASGDLERDLNILDPYKIWTWNPNSRKFDSETMKWQLPMWHRYRVELWPHYPGLLCGITDEHGHELQFPSAFRQQRDTFLPKGIIKIVHS